MNSQLQVSLEDILKLLMDSVKTVGQVASDQLPILIQEYLMWGLVSALIMLVIGLILGWAAWRLFRWVTRTEFDDLSMREPFTWIIVVVLATVACPVMIVNLLNVLQILIAPRLYLLEHVVRMVK